MAIYLHYLLIILRSSVHLNLPLIVLSFLTIDRDHMVRASRFIPSRITRLRRPLPLSSTHRVPPPSEPLPPSFSPHRVPPAPHICSSCRLHQSTKRHHPTEGCWWWCIGGHAVADPHVLNGAQSASPRSSEPTMQSVQALFESCRQAAMHPGSSKSRTSTP
jgi:hypothetical protein